MSFHDFGWRCNRVCRCFFKGSLCFFVASGLCLRKLTNEGDFIKLLGELRGKDGGSPGWTCGTWPRDVGDVDLLMQATGEMGLWVSAGSEQRPLMELWKQAWGRSAQTGFTATAWGLCDASQGPRGGRKGPFESVDGSCSLGGQSSLAIPGHALQSLRAVFPRHCTSLVMTPGCCLTHQSLTLS